MPSTNLDKPPATVKTVEIGAIQEPDTASPLTTEPAPNAVALETVSLTAPHTHAGREYLSGEKMAVTAGVKQWLLEHNLIADSSPVKPKLK